MAGAGASSSSENTRTGHPSARQVGTTALLIVVLVLLGHGWALHGVAGLMGQLSDPPQPASQISSPLLTRTIVKAAPTPTPQPPQPLAAPARSPPPGTAAVPGRGAHWRVGIDGVSDARPIPATGGAAGAHGAGTARRPIFVRRAHGPGFAPRYTACGAARHAPAFSGGGAAGARTGTGDASASADARSTGSAACAGSPASLCAGCCCAG